jgi:hypothetical protein
VDFWDSLSFCYFCFLQYIFNISNIFGCCFIIFFWSWILVIYFQISSRDRCNPISCTCSKLIPLIASSFSPTIVYRFLMNHTQIWPTMSFNLNKKFNKEYKQPPQSTRENSFQSNSKSKKTIWFSPQSLIFLISS